ncbi:Ger(x)C family spore germination protein [Brevibacillus choshinensis]|uniref:Ger(X)C family spore germination protein n=1 Tax=Brevibacillus choshinensis TaxID=54911 RepID=A0ABX7FR72_BRECH|nr:Ger(x)C family spore germination protein [Brevibacillus choshinensis]QRG68127.1 Ger(x)C family spore germination protein [Brevibacillus choshinensis]
MRQSTNSSFGTGKRFLSMWCAVTLLITGCSDRQIFDETGLVTVVGYDLQKDGNTRGTIVMPSINPEAKEKIQLISAVAKTSKGIRDQANLQSDKRVLGGQLRVALYNEALAKQGLGSIVDTLYRDPSISSRLYLCVYEGYTYDLLTYPYKELGNIGIYMYRMIEQNVRGEKIPSTTMHEFFRAYYDHGIDPQLPYIVRKGNEIQIKGVALFQGDRYVGWISPKEAFLIKMIHGKFRIGSYDTAVPSEVFGKHVEHLKNKAKDVQLVFDTISSKSRVKLTKESPAHFDVKIKLNARILELTVPLKVDEPDILSMMERALEKEMEGKLQRIVKRMQEMDVDPAGFGVIYRANRRGMGKMTTSEWRKMFKEATFRFKVDATIIRNGVMD